MQIEILNILTWMKVGYCEITLNCKHFTYTTCFIWMHGYLVIHNAKRWHFCEYAKEIKTTGNTGWANHCQ